MIIPVSFCEIVVDFVTDPVGRTASVVFGVGNPLGIGPNTVANTVAGSLAPWVHSTVSQHAAMVRVSCKNGPTATGPTGEFVTNIAGDVGGDLLSPNVCILHKKLTAFGGRQGRGRMFSPFTSESVVDGLGNVDPTHLDSLVTADQQLLDDLEADGHGMVLLHNAVANTPDPVTSLVPQPTAATQRRRLRR